GFTLSESAWMSTRALSWMNVVIGDPLYRPFAFLSDFSASSVNKKNNIWTACRNILQNAKGDPVAAAAAFEAAATKTGNRAYLEFVSSMDVIAGKTNLAVDALMRAAQMSKDENERFRFLLKRIFILARNNQKPAAATLARDSQSQFPDPAKLRIL